MLKLKIISIIKKAGRYIIYTLSVLLVIILLLYFAFRTPTVQTWAAKKLTAYFSSSLNTQITLSGVDIELFKKIVLEGVYVSDLHGDTLLYAPELKVDISLFEYKKRNLVIKNLILENTTAKIIRYVGEDDYNYAFLVDAFSSKDTSITKTKPWNIRLESLQLRNVSFTYKDAHDTSEIDGLNYWDIQTVNTHAKIENIHFEGDTIYAIVNKLSAKEKSGFVLEELSCKASVSPTITQLNALTIKTPQSKISTDLTFAYSTYDDYNSFIDKVTMRASFNRTIINMSDVAYFAPELKGIDNTLLLSGKIKGKVDNLKGNDMLVEFGEKSSFKGDFNFKGLPDIDATFMVVDVENITTNKKDLEQIPIPPFTSKEKLRLPNNADLLGQMNFKGNFTGFLSDFVAYGTFNSALGKIESDISMVSDTTISKKVKYKGKIKSYDFDIGKYLYLDKNLGTISIDAMVEGSGLGRNDAAAKLVGKVNSIVFNKYSYQNIDIEGELTRRIFNGKLHANDPNLKLDFLGSVNFIEAIPQMSFSADIANANLFFLHIIDTDSLSNLNTKLDVNISGDDIDKLKGSAHVYGFNYKDSQGKYKIDVCRVEITEKAEGKAISLNSDFADMNMAGNFVLTQLPNAFESMLAFYVPSFSIGNSKKKEVPQQFTFALNFKKTDAFTRLFIPQLKISTGATINGKFDSGNNFFSFKANADVVDISGTAIKDWKIDAETKEQGFYITTSADYVTVTDSLKVFDPKLSLNTANKSNTIEADAEWFQSKEHDRPSSLNFSSHFESLDKSITKVVSSNIYVADSLWSMKQGENSIAHDTSSVKFGNISFASGSQEIKIYGAVSKDKRDKLLLGLTNFSLTNLNPFIKSSGVKLSGFVSGETSVSDIYDKFLLTNDISVRRLVFNNELIGDGVVNSVWDREKEGITMSGAFARDTLTTNMRFKGIYYPYKKQNSLDFNVDLYAIRLQLFNEYVKDYCSVFVGDISGAVSIKGTPNIPVLNGKLKANARNIKVDYLNTSFRFNGDILIDNNSFGVNELKISDSKSEEDQRKIGIGTAWITGKLYHDNFENFQLDFDMKADKFQCLNTNESLNELYYGKANITGIANIFGYLNNIAIDANLKTEKGTQFNIPLTSTEEVSELGFVTFTKKEKDTVALAKKYKVDLAGMRLNFDLEVTPMAEVQLIFDSKIGDIIRGRGNGNIKMQISTLGDFNMYGDLIITEGDYLFTLKNLINKKFDIEPGGTIKWTGDPYEATANITAVYRQRASIHPFFPNDSSAIYKKRYPVDCKLKMTDKLMEPLIAFDIDLPTLDENTRQQIKSYISTEQEMNKQVFSLLILKSFVTPPQLAGVGVSDFGAADVGMANSTELLSNQLSNWLSQISKDFDVGVKYRPGDNLSSDELEVALSTQVFNDRLSIDGNLGVTNGANTQQQNTSNIAGDVNIEYKITDDGKLRVRAFNKANDNTLLASTTAPYTQGVGVFYKEEFNSLGELYRRFLAKMKKKKNDDAQPQP